jgi:endonuclease/exonuclease/phosphatase family metal-dependent hydrolase
MRIRVISIVFLLLTACDQPVGTAMQSIDMRIATFNVSMGLQQEHQLGQALSHGEDSRLRKVAEILQRVRPDIVLLNEFDYDPDSDAAGLFNQNYLLRSQNGQPVIQYPYSFRAPVNTGLDSGLDLDGDGTFEEPEDAFGYGAFPGQYGMLVLSRFPILSEKSRTFQNLPWSALPAARRPRNPDGSDYYSDEIWSHMRLSSKSHWDVVIDIEGREFHLLAYHPTPPVFDGPEDRNGLRNFDETRFWLEYLQADSSGALVDDAGAAGGLASGSVFVIAGDLNADPFDGDSVKGAINQLLSSPMIDSSCLPTSAGGPEASALQGEVNLSHQGDPAADTSDFNDKYVGNLRLDYLLPSRGLAIRGCGVFWPGSQDSSQDTHDSSKDTHKQSSEDTHKPSGDTHHLVEEPSGDTHNLVEVSDHRMVWMDISL